MKLDPHNRDACQDVRYNRGITLGGNPLISPPPEVVEQGTGAVVAYLQAEQERQQAQIRQLVLAGSSGLGLIGLLILGFRLKQRGRRKDKPKRDAA